MTQHWWMHWFWITTLHTAAILTTTDAVPTPDASLRVPTPLTLSQGQEQPPLRTPVSIGTEPRVPLTFPYPALSDSDDTDPSPVDTPMTLVVPVRPKQLPEVLANATEPTVTKVTKKPDVKYKLFVNRTVEINKPVIKTTKTTTEKPSVSTDDDPDDATTTSEAPLIDTTSDDDLVEEFSTDSGDFKPSLATILAASESRVTRGEVMLGRASEYPRSELDPAVIAGISLGVVGIVTLSSAIGFVFYRRRYLNKPQTLSDKCSNPDSTGYIDDSTIRENSEEMYSLDNDSFLNSLEAMTIQNYWTDSVKHTKL